MALCPNPFLWIKLLPKTNFNGQRAFLAIVIPRYNRQWAFIAALYAIISGDWQKITGMPDVTFGKMTFEKMFGGI